MQRDRHERIYALHSWTGITLGWFLYLIVFSGCIALFEKEIRTWEDPARRRELSEHCAPMHAALESFVAEASTGHELRFVTFTFASVTEPYHAARVGTRDADGRQGVEHRRWDPSTARPLAEHEMGLSEWLVELHRSLAWPKSLGGFRVGRTLVGISGLALLLSLLTGWWIHTKRLSSLFLWRGERSDRLRWQDSHKVLGLWGLPFSSAIGATGAMLGLASVVAPIALVLAYQGDIEGLEQAFSPPEAPEASDSTVGPDFSIWPIDRLADLRHPQTGLHPVHIHFDGWSDAPPLATLRFPADRALRTFDKLVVDATTGEAIPDQRASPSTIARLNATIGPLHFGNYGGISLKLVYFALGLLLAAGVSIGNAMWVARRSPPRGSDAIRPGLRAIARVNVGITWGLPLATIALFHVDKLVFARSGSPFAAMAALYALFVAGAVGAALQRHSQTRATTDLIRACGFLCVALPVVDWATTGALFAPARWAAPGPHLWVDASALTLGGALLLLAPRVTRFAARSAKP